MMNDNIKKELFDLKITINKARYNLMFMVILSIINIVFIITNGNAIMPFSCSIATYSTSFAIENSMLPVGLAISTIILAVLLICYYKSKNNVLFLVSPIGIIIVDTLALICIAIFSGSISTFNFPVDLIFHIVSIFYLIKAIKAYKSLGDFNSISDEMVNESKKNAYEHFDEEDDYDCDALEDISEPIGKYIDDGTEPILSAEFNNFKIFVVVRNGKAELVINGYVCDELDVAYLSDYELNAIVNDVSYRFQYTHELNIETSYLYADDKLLDSLRKIL